MSKTTRQVLNLLHPEARRSKRYMKYVTLADATVHELQICAKHAGFDEMRNHWGPDFVYGDDVRPQTVERVRALLSKRYTHVDVTDRNMIEPCRVGSNIPNGPDAKFTWG